MKTIYDLKPSFQNKLRPITQSLANDGVTANQITLLAALMSVCYGFILLLFYPYKIVFLLMPAILFIRMALNAIDGMLAREHGQKSALGGMLNEIGDVISDAALYLPLALALSPPSWILFLTVIFALVGEVAGVAAVQVGAERRYDGPFGKSDRAVGFGVLCFLIGLGVPQGPWVAVVAAIMLALSVYTVINRTRQAVKQVAETAGSKPKKAAAKKSTKKTPPKSKSTKAKTGKSTSKKK